MSQPISSQLVYANPALRFQAFESELVAALRKVLASDQLILGEEVQTFETSFAQYLSVAHCVGVNSGTDALILALEACGLQKGDEVIAPALTAHGTLVAILRAGLTPVIVDVKSPTLCIDPVAIEKAITPKTKAVLPVHLHGYPAQMAEIESICDAHDLLLIEDCAQAHGSTIGGQMVGSFGDVAAFSFYPTKNLGCLGDGGAVVTSSHSISEKLKALRWYGIEPDGDIQKVGINSRLDELQAGILNELLPHLSDYNKRRADYARHYHEALEAFDEYLPPIVEGSVYHQFALRVPHRDLFMHRMLEKGIQLGHHYPFTMKDLTAFREYCHDVPVATKAAAQLISLPIQPEILDMHFDFVVDSVRACLS